MRKSMTAGAVTSPADGKEPIVSPRLKMLFGRLARRRLDAAVIRLEANVRAFAGIECDNAVLVLTPDGRAALYTDFRYAPMVRRVAPWLQCRDLRALRLRGRRIGYETAVTHAQFLAWQKLAPRAAFVDVSRDLALLRAVKSPEEIAALRRAEALDCEIWQAAKRGFRPGMSELDMARSIRRMMIDRGDGGAFATIVCIGKNAAECHHVPDDTRWDGREPVLVDMGVKLDGWCSDLTRNLLPARPSRAYREAYRLVREANAAAIAAARPGMTGKALDAVARRIIAKGGFGRAFGHSLGHGVGLEIHEPPYASKSSDWVLKPGMLVTIEPGIYLEGNFGIRIEDLILITEDGCEVLSGVAPCC